MIIKIFNIIINFFKNFELIENSVHLLLIIFKQEKE